MAFASHSTYFNTGDSSIIGNFRELDSGNLFEYSKNDVTEGPMSQFPHKIWVSTPMYASNGMCLESGFRYGTVLKTRCYIALDEDEYGNPVPEKWHFVQKSHNIYQGV